MSNPEFKRNLWLSFSTHRLVGMPALLALLFTAVALAESDNDVAGALYTASVSAFIFIVWLWGARNANATIVDELRDKTWDQQRMSALDPWTMAWGKLFGSTSFNWYGGIMCLAVIATSGYAGDKPHVLSTLLSLAAVGILLHAVLIALNLHTAQFESRLIRRGGMGWLVIIVVFLLLPSYGASESKPIVWWDVEMNSARFWLGSALLFAACATFAAWRVMSNALQVRTLPWAWPTFACILAVYFAGFVPGADLQALLLTGLFVADTMTYAALLTEPITLLHWRKLRLLQQKEDWRGWLEHLPVWPGTLALTFVFAILMVLTWGENDVLSVPTDFIQPQHALAVALMLLRDACVLMFFSFAPDNRRAVGTAVLYLIVINILLPFLAGVAGLDTLRYFFLPFEAENDPWRSVLVMTLHAAIAIGLVNWRLRKTETP